MKAVILIGLENAGLAPLCENTPCAFLEVADGTAVRFAVRAAANAGAHEIYALSRRADSLASEYFENVEFDGRTVRFVQYDDALAERLADLCGTEDVLAIDACGLPFDDMGGLVREFERGARFAAAVAGSSLSGCGEEYATGETGGIFAQAAVFSSEMINELSDSGARTLSALAASALRLGGAKLVKSEGAYCDFGTVGAYRAAVMKRLESGEIKGEIARGIYCAEDISLSGITLIPPVYIGKNVTLGKGCVIERCAVGNGARIGERARLSGCVVGEAAAVGDCVQARGAVIFPAAVIGKSAYMGENSAAGERAAVGAAARVMPKARIFAGTRTGDGETLRGDVRKGTEKFICDDDGAFLISFGELDPGTAAALAMAAGTALGAGTHAVCGCGEGDEAQAILAAFESGLRAAGVNVLSAGRSAENEVRFLTSRLSARYGFYVDCGAARKIAFMTAGGLPPSQRVRAAAQRAFSLARYAKVPADGFGALYDISGAKGLYGAFLAKFLPDVFHGINADLRCADPTLAALFDRLVRKRNDVDGERVIFNISCDGARCTAYSESSGFVSGDRLRLIAVNAAFSWGKPVCVPVTFTAAADELAERAGAKLYRYGFCPDEMSVSAETAAREDNLFMRDGAALACMICSFMAKSGKTLGELTAEIPQFYTVERFAAADAGRSELMRIFGCRCDGGEAGTVICKGGERALVRPLKRRKGVMIYVESAKTEAAEELCGEIMKRLGK